MDQEHFIKRLKLHHLLIWLVIGSIWFYLRYNDYSTTRKAITVTLIKTADLAMMIYITNYLFIPWLLYRKKYAVFVLSFIGMILISSCYKMYLIGRVTNNPALFNWSGNLKGRFYDNILPHFFLVTAGVAIKLMFDYISVEKKLAQVAKERAEAELNFLKSQINPHFLFNSLNSVYFLIDKENTEARKALHKFSDMLRYQLYELKGEKIAIEKEIGYLQDYIDLQKLRTEDCKVLFQVEEGLNSFSIEPLLLIPFVENSFKHISHYGSGKANEIAIKLSEKGGMMNFSVRNTTEGKQVHEPGKEGGIGLLNVKRRLELLYPHMHQLKIMEEPGLFEVELAIKINNSDGTDPLHHY
jgi:two-component system LytT family sensor kinase